MPGSLGRDFRADFLLPALRGLDVQSAQRVAVAMDAAIAFGVLEYVDGNPSLQDLGLVRTLYADKIRRLHTPGDLAPVAPVS